MSQEERFNSRDRSYSAWHRRASIARFVGIERAQTLAMIDLDASQWVEYDDCDKEPLFFIETAIDTGQQIKPATVTKNVARLCSHDGRIVPAFIVLYKLSNRPNPADSEWKDIDQVRVKRIWPEPETPWETLEPKDWAKRLVRLREWATRQLDQSHRVAS